MMLLLTFCKSLLVAVFEICQFASQICERGWWIEIIFHHKILEIVGKTIDYQRHEFCFW